jgi:hypothetical protein
MLISIALVSYSSLPVLISMASLMDVKVQNTWVDIELTYRTCHLQNMIFDVNDSSLVE